MLRTICRQPPGLALHLVEIDDRGLLFVGQVSIEPERDGVERLFRQFDELLAPERREIDHLGSGRRCRQDGGGNENGACDFTGHSFLARMRTATPRGAINASVAVQKSASFRGKFEMRTSATKPH